MDYDFAARFGELAREARIVLSVHAPIAGFMGHAERGKKLNMAVGMLDHSAGIAKAAGAEVVVFHPGFLLGRTREEAIDSVCEQLGELRERLEEKDRAVPFGVEVMGRVRELGSLDDVVEISRRCRLGPPRARLRAHARDLRRRVHRRRAVRRGARGRGRRARAGRAVPHPLLATSSSRTATRRSTCPTARARCAPSRCAGARAVRAAGDRDLGVARRGVDQAIQGGAGGLGQDAVAAGLELVRLAVAARGRAGTERAPAGARTGASGARSRRACRTPGGVAPRPPRRGPARREQAPSDIVVVASEVTSCGPTVSRAASANRSASSILPCESRSSASERWRLAQRRAVLQRREDPDRLAEEPLGAGDLALVPRGPAGEVERAAEHPRRTGLGEVLAGRLERGLGIVELAPVQVQLAGEAERPSARHGAAALLGEQDRLLDQRLGAIEFEPREVDARELVGGLALEALVPGRARELERLEHHLLLLGEIAAHPGDRGGRPQRAEAARVVVAARAPPARCRPSARRRGRRLRASPQPRRA